MGQQRAKPRFIEQHLLMGCLPEGTSRLCLAPGRKSLLLDSQGNERFEVLSLGIVEACLPFPHRFAGDAQVLGQARLSQSNHGAQGQDGLSKGVVSIAVRGSLHGRSLSVSPTQTQRWEGMGGANATRNATLCPVTSHTLTSILQTRDDHL